MKNHNNSDCVTFGICLKAVFFYNKTSISACSIRIIPHQQTTPRSRRDRHGLQSDQDPSPQAGRKPSQQLLVLATEKEISPRPEGPPPSIPIIPTHHVALSILPTSLFFSYLPSSADEIKRTPYAPTTSPVTR